MASQLTYTGKTGPGTTVTAQTTTDVQSVTFDFAKKVATVFGPSGQIREYDLAATTTLTCTITVGANATMVVSQ